MMAPYFSNGEMLDATQGINDPLYVENFTLKPW